MNRAMDRGLRALAALPILFAIFAMGSAANADAAAQRNLKETFGSAEKPPIESSPGGIVINHATGDLLIPSEVNGVLAIRRYHADGKPAPFSALGGNAIDGAEVNGEPCPQQPASCDATPLGGIELEVPETNGGAQFQIAIDESGGVADGDIYLTQTGEIGVKGSKLVDIFASDGRYLGELTGHEGAEYEYEDNFPTGVAVDSDGTVYVANAKKAINEFAPVQNPVTNDDFVANLVVPESKIAGTINNGAAGLALGTGPTAGSLFAALSKTVCRYDARQECVSAEHQGTESIVQLDKETGQLLAEFDVSPFGSVTENVRGLVTVNPTNGNVIDGRGVEFEVRSGSKPTRVSHLDQDAERYSAQETNPGFAVNDLNELIGASAEVGKSEGSVIGVRGAPAPVPTVTIDPAGEITGTRATLSGTVDPVGLPLTGEKCYFEYGPIYQNSPAVAYEKVVPCEESIPADSKAHPVHAKATGLSPAGYTYGARLVVTNANGQEESSPKAYPGEEVQPVSFTTVGTVVTEPATAVTLSTATLAGSVLPEGSDVVECSFEYGLATSADFEKSVPCNPEADEIRADFQSHKVGAAVSGLQSGTTYRYRLVATSADQSIGTVAGEEETFTTPGLPKVEEVRASGADQSSVTLEARINPSGFGTHYRFEWGPTPAYGNVAPLEFEPFIGAGTEPTLVKARLTGLAPGTGYHYRVVAESNRGHTESADQIAETLNHCELPEGRCYEEVSRRQAGPVAIPGESNAQIELHFQAANTPGAFAYPVESGYPDATKGAEVLYRGTRAPSGWESTQLSAPISALNERADITSQNSKVDWLSDDLSCGFQETISPLTPDPGMNLVRELGGANLYRMNPDNSYTPITTLPPQNVDPERATGLNNYEVAWGSQDCGVTVFSSRFTYPGIPTEARSSFHLYEWREGVLRNAGLVPGPDGEEVAVAAVAGTGRENRQNTVSADGSKVFFSAARQSSPDEAEIEGTAVFVRENGRVTRDVSLSQTDVPDEGATYQWATPDGSKVFFTANSGLAPGTSGSGKRCLPASGEGCELYEYDLGTGALTDRSATSVAGGAQVRGFLGASADGSRVYFASRSRLVPGAGNPTARNERAGTYSIYSEADGKFAFAGTLERSDLVAGLIENQSDLVSQVSPDGRYLVFESRAPVTGYGNEGLPEVYLFDTDTQATTCVSCRQDGRPSEGDRYGRPDYALLPRGRALHNELRAPQFLAERDGEAKVFFSSPDPLAPGAVAGQNNIYEWSHDQVFRLASAPAGSQSTPFPGLVAIFGGASLDATDVYLITPETLSWEDGDKRASAYDARVGGGFPETPPGAGPCRAAAERSCAAPPPTAGRPQGPDTSTVAGSQNAEPKKKKHPNKKHRKKKHHRKKHSKGKHHKKQSSKGKKTRGANGNRRNGK